MGRILGLAALLAVGCTPQTGVSDCYSLIRDWYRTERGIALPEFPRDWEWWEYGGDLYAMGFAEAGFVKLPENDGVMCGRPVISKDFIGCHGVVESGHVSGLFMR